MVDVTQRVEQLVEPESLVQTRQRLRGAPHVQRIVVVLVGRLGPVVAHRHLRIRAADQLARGRRAALHGLGNHGGQLPGEVRRNLQCMGIVEVVHQRVDGQIRDRPVNPFESADRDGVGVGERPVQVPGGGIDLVDIEREGDDGHAVGAVFGRGGFGEVVGHHREVSGNLHVSSIAHERDVRHPAAGHTARDGRPAATSHRPPPGFIRRGTVEKESVRPTGHDWPV